MNNKVAKTSPAAVTLLDMRKDPVRFPRLGAVSREQAIIYMTKIVHDAFLFLGREAEANNEQFIAVNLVDELRLDSEGLGTKSISFAEISRVVKRAVLNDDLYGISVASLYKVIIAYVKGEGHQLDKEASGNITAGNYLPIITAYAGALAKNSKT